MRNTKSLLLIIAMMLVWCAFPTSAKKIDIWGTFPKAGNGDSGNPYEIRTAHELRWFVNYENRRHWYPNDYAVLMNDIDLSEICGPEKGSWIPLGYSEEDGAKDHWYGNLDGKGFTIKNMYIDGNDFESDSPALGFMGKVTSATVKNLTIEGEIVNGKGKVGGLIGWNYDYSATLENCYSKVTISSSDENVYLGGADRLFERLGVHKCR